MYTVEWQVEGESLLVELSGEITAADIKNQNDYIIETYLNNSESKIHLIVIGTKISKIPANVSEVAAASKELANHPKLGMSVYVDMVNPILAFLANTTAKVLGYPYKMCKTYDEALRILERYKET